MRAPAQVGINLSKVHEGHHYRGYVWLDVMAAVNANIEVRLLANGCVMVYGKLRNDGTYDKKIPVFDGNNTILHCTSLPVVSHISLREPALDGYGELLDDQYIFKYVQSAVYHHRSCQNL